MKEPTYTPRVHRGREVVEFVLAHPNQLLTLEQIHDGIGGGWSLGSVSGAVAGLMKSEPRVRREGRGKYIYDTRVNEPAKVERTEFMISVIARKEDGVMLVRDMEDDTQLYVLKPFEF